MTYRQSTHMVSSTVLKAGAVGVGVVLLLGLLTIPLWTHTTPEGHVGVQKDWGAVTGNTYEPGFHVVAPISEGVQDVEVRPRTYTMTQDVGEGDRNDADAITVKTINGSTVAVDITVRYRIDSSQAEAFVEEWNNAEQMEQRLIRPTIRSQLRDEASSLQTTGTDAIYTQDGREALASTAREALQNEFSDQPIVLEAVQVRNIDLPDEIDQTLDQKEQAKQQVQVERERVKQEEARAEQQIVQAEADARATEIRAEAIRENPVILQDRYIEALRQGSVFVVGGGNGSSPPIIVDGIDAARTGSVGGTGVGVNGTATDPPAAGEETGGD